MEKLGLLVAQDDWVPGYANDKQNHNEHHANNQQLSVRCSSPESCPDINCKYCGCRVKHRSKGRHKSCHHNRQHKTSQPYYTNKYYLSYSSFPTHRPVGKRSSTRRMKAMLVQPDGDWHMAIHFTGSDQPTSFLWRTQAAMPGRTSRKRGINFKVPASSTPPLA